MSFRSPKPNCSTFMPGKPRLSRRCSTSGVMIPRSSAKIGRLFTKCLFNCEEEILARSLHPFSIDCSLFICRDSPVCFKATEMVDTQEIGQSELTADTVDPPFIAGGLMVVPIIERIAPQLSGRTEIIWRDSGYAGRVALRIELEQLLVCPDVGAVRVRRRSGYHR